MVDAAEREDPKNLYDFLASDKFKGFGARLSPLLLVLQCLGYMRRMWLLLGLLIASDRRFPDQGQR